MTTRLSRAIAALLLAAALPALAALGDRRVQAQASFAQCPVGGSVDRPTLRVFESAAQWQSETRLNERATFGREIGWSRERVVLFALAQQPTLGVRIHLDSERVAARNGVLRVPIEVRRPGAAESSATALSRPCVMLAAARAARRGWHSVQVVDVTARVLVEGEVAALSSPSNQTPNAPDLGDVMKRPAPPR